MDAAPRSVIAFELQVSARGGNRRMKSNASDMIMNGDSVAPKLARCMDCLLDSISDDVLFGNR